MANNQCGGAATRVVSAAAQIESMRELLNTPVPMMTNHVAFQAKTTVQEETMETTSEAREEMGRTAISELRLRKAVL